MKEPREKIYVGSGKSKFDGDQVAISVCLTDLPKEWMFEYKDKKYVKLIVQKKKEEDQYGKTHYVAIDTFKPEQQSAAPAEVVKEDLPF